jgi:uncharacterized membrane protein YtjA (UPF0391 family)
MIELDESAFRLNHDNSFRARLKLVARCVSGAGYVSVFLEAVFRGRPEARLIDRELPFLARGSDGRKAEASGKEGGRGMLSWSITFLVIALIAALLGFSGIAGMAAGFAKILFAVFLILFVVSLLFGRKAV